MPDLRFWLSFVASFTIVVAVLMVGAAIHAWWDWKKDQMTAEDRMKRALVIFLLAAAIVIFLIAGMIRALAQHPPEHMALHDKFYKTWMMPDHPSISCCHDEDCKPAEAHMRNGQWYARQEGDSGDFTPIPPQKVEQNRDTPDGRNHLCGRRYSFNGNNQFSVFCFVAGQGG